MGPRREHQGRTIRKEVRIAADPEQVWNAWARADGIARWFVDRAVGDMEAGATVRWIFESFGYDLPVEVYEAEPGRYLAFGGEVPGKPPALQEIVVTGEEGVTRLRLANSGFLDGEEWDDEYEGVDSGWEMALATLRYVLENRCPEPRRHRIAMRPARYEYADLQPLFGTAEGLRAWLAEDAELGAEPLEVGAACALRLADGTAWRGTVLARSPRELLLGRDDGRETLGLKCFSMGPRGRFVGLDWNAWGPAGDERDDDAVEAWLQAAVERLAARFPADG